MLCSLDIALISFDHNRWVEISVKQATAEEKDAIIDTCLSELAAGKCEEDVLYLLVQAKAKLAAKYAAVDAD
jgi:hypothetical protein